MALIYVVEDDKNIQEIETFGSGIGLSIVKAIMDSHNKACGVQNVKDGVEFWFTLDCSI